MMLIERVKKILLSPKAEWTVIEAEATPPQQLYTGYVVPLAAIPVVASLIDSFRLRVPLGMGLRSAVVQYVMALVDVFVIGLIIEMLAPSFGGQKNRNQALKVAAYSMTAAWVAGAFNIIPTLDVLVLLGKLYGLYLLYMGLPALMKAPSDKAVGYTAVVIVCAIVVLFVTHSIVEIFAWPPRPVL